jgi:streptomycin 6-kinase
VAPLTLPKNLVEWAAEDLFPERRNWVAGLPGTLAELADRWSLRVGEPYQPGGLASWVAPVWDAAGRELVLKVGWHHVEAAHEADGLRAWHGAGAVLLHDAYVFGATSALLIERCRPGTTLKLAASEPEQDLVVAGLLQRLWTASPDAYPFRSLQVMCDEWASEFEHRLAASPGLLDWGLARAGMELFRALPATAEHQVLLCTDLHAGNILAAQREPWLMIDPKPYLGDPAYDLLQHLINCQERLVANPLRLVRRMAGLLALDADRVTRWLFARSVQESIDQPWLGHVAAALAADLP